MHARIDELLSLRDGAPVDARVRAHVNHCAECAAALAGTATVRDRLRALPSAPEPARDGWTELQSRLAQRHERSRQLARIAPFAAAASVAALAVFAALRGFDAPIAAGQQARVADRPRDSVRGRAAGAFAGTGGTCSRPCRSARRSSAPPRPCRSSRSRRRCSGSITSCRSRAPTRARAGSGAPVARPCRGHEFAGAAALRRGAARRPLRPEVASMQSRLIDTRARSWQWRLFRGAVRRSPRSSRSRAEPAERAELEKELAEARTELDQAAREVAELSRQLYGGGESGDVMRFVARRSAGLDAGRQHRQRRGPRRGRRGPGREPGWTGGAGRHQDRRRAGRRGRTGPAPRGRAHGERATRRVHAGRPAGPRGEGRLPA